MSVMVRKIVVDHLREKGLLKMTLTVLHSSGRTGFELPALLTAKPMRAPLAWLRFWNREILITSARCWGCIDSTPQRYLTLHGAYWPENGLFALLAF